MVNMRNYRMDQYFSFKMRIVGIKISKFQYDQSISYIKFKILNLRIQKLMNLLSIIFCLISCSKKFVAHFINSENNL